jgi:hypothetical protein
VKRMAASARAAVRRYAFIVAPTSYAANS